MRVLTVRQPWAWAIIHGGKDIENRTRNIAGTYRGPIAIHAGLSSATVPSPVLLSAIFDAGRVHFDSGAIIGVVDLVDVHHSDNCPGRTVGEDVGTNIVTGYHATLCSPWAEFGGWHLVLANPRPLAEPIPARGRLGLWEFPDDLLP